ncbi:hypothetical protein N0V93_002571 [Gnomoniopsis smithogilvyi]|uniref:Uncharacterized protein n=1 Tax=Gnomoniopsis smithogilvyi TaxID=1191159 RepID=A0A9W8YXV4_9PEZI|nr:hypothetical protein N0V93_002571 [Gnomoniopsis smithogilvyi]
MCSSSLRRCLAAAAAMASIPGGIATSHHRRSVPPFQVKPTHQFSAKAMSGIPSLSWPSAHANETYIALGLEMPIVGIMGSDPELIFLGAESYLLFMQDGMTMSAYNHLNISDNLLSSSADPLVTFNESSSIFSDSPFSSSSDSADLRLLAVLLYKSDTQSQSAVKQSSSSSSSKGVLSEIADLLDGDTQRTGEFDWNAWAADMNANPVLRMDFDISDFANKAGLGTPVAAEVLIIKDEAELTDSLDTAESWDIVSTLYKTGAAGNAVGTATAIGAAASSMGAAANGMGAAISRTGAAATGARAGPAGLGIMPSGADQGIAMSPSGAGAGSGLGAAATGSPVISTGPDSESDDTGAEPAMASDTTGSSAGGPQYMSASPNSSSVSSGASGSSSSNLAVIPLASDSTLGAAASTGRPVGSTGPPGASNSSSDNNCGDGGNASMGAAVVSGSGGLPLTAARPTGAGFLGPSGMPSQPKYPFPQYSGASDGVRPLLNATAAVGQGNATRTTPTRSAAGAGITGGGKAAPAHGEQVTIDIDIGSEFETTITANLKYRNARRTVDAKPGWTLTLKTDLIAPTSSYVKMAEATSSTAVPTSMPRYVYRQESSTLRTTALATGPPVPSSIVAPSSFVTTSSAFVSTIPTQTLSFLGLVCISLLVVSL